MPLKARVAAILKDLAANPANGIASILEGAELKALGGYSRASFAVDMKNGFYSGAGVDVLLKTPSSKGGHGFTPSRPELHASLVMAGPQVTARGSLGLVRMTQIGRTVASWSACVCRRRPADTPLSVPAATGADTQ